MSETTAKVPVTVLTGFLGAGKTTFLNKVLSAPQGKRYAVIVNEFGEIGIDNELIVSSDEEIFEMSNGCVCCTVRGDLIRVISGLLRRPGRFDAIIIETTGLADPAPVAQTFFTDADIAAKTKLESVICLVDAYHIMEQLGAVACAGAEATAKQSRPTYNEAENQIAFADSIVLNKTDLVKEAELTEIEETIRTLNPFAKLYRAERGAAPLEEILGQGGFDLEKILETAPAFLQEEPHHHHGKTCGCGCHGHKAPSRHATDISSVSLTADKPLDTTKLQNWLGDLAATKGPDLLRYKGILDLAAEDKRIVIQGVHMMMEGSALSAWPEGEKRQSRLIFIGHKLDEAALRAGFEACIA